MVNGTATAATITIADDETYGAFLTPDLSLAAGDYVHLKCEEFGGPAVAGFVRYGYEVETTGSTQAVFFGNGTGALNSYPVKFGGVLNQIAQWVRDIDGGPGDCINVLPIAGTVTGYRVRITRGLPVGFLTGRFTIYKSTDDGATFVAQNGSGGTTDTRLTLTTAAIYSQASASFSLSVARGDLLYMRWDADDADGAQWGCSVGVTFISSVADQWPYCGEPLPISGNSAQYNAIFAPNSFAWSGSDTGRVQSEGGYSDFSLAKFILYRHTAPGAGDTSTFETYLNGAPQTLAVTLSDSDQIAEDLIHAVPVVFGDTFGIKLTQTGTPSSSKVSWGFIQDTSTAPSGGGEIPGDLPILGEIGPYMVHHWPREIP